MLDLEPIKARVEAASEPPWLTPEQASSPYSDNVPVEHEGCYVWPWKGEYQAYDEEGNHKPTKWDDKDEANMIFAYAARTDVPELIAEVERLRNQVDELRSMLDASRGARGLSPLG